ncbi:acetyltransferase [Pedobacter sp. ASV12]|uniref:acetyltransferase n=1 Tax=Pedobacter sp. ASV12 TaxID=2795120 RepID=UPI0018EBAA4E|nr:acetyltransferase [Pedobacter sp. ASV12]
MHIIGAGGHAKVVADILLSAKHNIDGVWDENLQIKQLLHYPIKGNLANFKELGIEQFIIAVGNNLIRKKIAAQLQRTKAVALASASSVSSFAMIEKGTVVMPNASINAGAVIGAHVIVNTNASIDHDCRVADFVHISPQAGLAGAVEVGEGTHIGIGASIIQGVKIGKWVTIGAGAVVIKDVPDYAVVVGNPGRIIKYNLNE